MQRILYVLRMNMPGAIPVGMNRPPMRLGLKEWKSNPSKGLKCHTAYVAKCVSTVIDFPETVSEIWGKGELCPFVSEKEKMNSVFNAQITRVQLHCRTLFCRDIAAGGFVLSKLRLYFGEVVCMQKHSLFSYFCIPFLRISLFTSGCG